MATRTQPSGRCGTQPKCENIAPNEETVASAERESQRLAIGEAYLLGTPARVDIAQRNDACYRTVSDEVLLPQREQFDEPVGFYQTALHELAHATGHESRLDRRLNENPFGSARYIREELVARGGGVPREHRRRPRAQPRRERSLHQNLAAERGGHAGQVAGDPRESPGGRHGRPLRDARPLRLVAAPDPTCRASEDVDVVAHVMSGSRDEDPGEQHKLQPGSGHGTDYRFGENVGFRVMVEHDGRCTSSAPPARGCGDRGQTEPAHRNAYPTSWYADCLPTAGDRRAESARRSPGQPARGSTKTQRGDNGLGYKRDVNRELRDSTYDRTREPTRIVGNKKTDAKTSCGGERRWPETAASRPGEAVWTEHRERASAKADEPEPAVAGDRDESRGGEEPGTVQERGCVQQALRDFTNERNGGWRRAASTACLERGWQESQRTRQRTGSATSRVTPASPLPLPNPSCSYPGLSSFLSSVSTLLDGFDADPPDVPTQHRNDAAEPQFGGHRTGEPRGGSDGGGRETRG